MQLEFYWTTEVHGLEIGGPFPTIKEAQEDCVRECESCGVQAEEIRILQTVVTGYVERVAA